MSRAMNFTAGPAALPLPALERAQTELLDFAGTGMSVMEHSHRGAAYEAVHDEAIALLRELAGISSDYEVLFLQGGASMQFAQVPMNLLHSGQSADYVVTGVWGEKGVLEAKLVAAASGAKVRVAATTATSEGENPTYVRVPTASEYSLDPNAAYVHVTSNETIHGVQFQDLESVFPNTGDVPIVVDMSSDILSRKMDISRYGLIYAGAQKNIGPSGICVVIVRKDILERCRKDIPKIFRYDIHAKNNSLYNTPPTFSIYLVRNVLTWIKSVGGISQIEDWNRQKSALIYGAIDKAPSFYLAPVDHGSRSTMNIVFRLKSEALEAQFVSEASKRSMKGLKGHRSVGGIRVSLYNAVSVEWAKALADFMGEFAANQRAHG